MRDSRPVRLSQFKRGIGISARRWPAGTTCELSGLTAGRRSLTLQVLIRDAGCGKQGWQVGFTVTAMAGMVLTIFLPGKPGAPEAMHRMGCRWRARIKATGGSREKSQSSQVVRNWRDVAGDCACRCGM